MQDKCRRRAIKLQERSVTLRTGGKANLHQGAIGAGVDISSGLTTYAVDSGTERQTMPEYSDRQPGRIVKALEACRGKNF
jgi:hypothetical protein